MRDVCIGISKANTAIIFRTGTMVLRLDRDQTSLLSGSVGKECIRAYQIPVILRATIGEILGDGRTTGGYGTASGHGVYTASGL